MRKQRDNRAWRKPRRWRRAGILAAAGILSLAGCSTFDSGTTASAPDPFLGPGTAQPPKIAAANVQPPLGTTTPPPAYAAAVLPAAAAPNPSVSLAALAPTSVHPLSDREDLRIGSPRSSQNGEGWTPTSGTSIAGNGSKATLTPPETGNPPARTPAPTTLVQNTNPPPTPQPVSNPQPPAPAPVAATQDPPQRSDPIQRPTTVEAAAAILKDKGASYQLPSQNGQTGEWLFRCGIENLKTNKINTYEGRASDQLGAMLIVLDQINESK